MGRFDVMARSALVGAAAFGITGLFAAYVWTLFEFPLVLAIQWMLGWGIVALINHPRKAGLAAVVGGLTYTGAFFVGMFLAITDGSPLPITGWLAVTLAAAIAGAATGAVLDGYRGATVMAGASASGMLVGTIIAGFFMQLAPDAVNVEGTTQYLYVALTQGVVGAFAGAAIGAAAAWLKSAATVEAEAETEAD